MHGLLFSILRLNRGLKTYELQFKRGWAFKPGDWEIARDFEAVLNAARTTSTLAHSIW